jgi:small subunit ribosomal protein S9
MEKYFEAVGRRKTSVARVRLFPKGKDFLINQRSLENYFPTFELQKIAKEALEKVDCLGKFGISVIVKGGGIHSQAEAVRHGIARALVLQNPKLRPILKEASFLKRDPRMRERKKFGLKRARRAPQWQKR